MDSRHPAKTLCTPTASSVIAYPLMSAAATSTLKHRIPNRDARLHTLSIASESVVR
jgi:hypothetical protein